MKKQDKAKQDKAQIADLYVVGIDLDDKPRGGRFEVVDDRVANVAFDLGLTAVIKASTEFAEAAKKLPPGRLYASGKAFIPNIKEALLTELTSILRRPGDDSEAYQLEKRPTKPGQAEAEPTVRCRSPITSGLPRNWDEISIGHLVLAQETLEEGFWECICQKREGDLLTLRYRDAPEYPAFVRHVTTVCLFNPGVFTDNN